MAHSLAVTEFGIYLHIPYCLQRCRYCDFATFVEGEIPHSDQYIALLVKEIAEGPKWFLPKSVNTIYFGGGTPSLLSAQQLEVILQALHRQGYVPDTNAEITIEINPATLTQQKLDSYRALGINRLSVGAQTFSDQHLQRLGRKHTAQDTRATLDLIATSGLNYSFDLLFAIPHQTMEDLQMDLLEVARYRPHHISPYCLTVPTGHPLNQNRPSDDEQVAMFQQIDQSLRSIGYDRYEISNYARDGFVSRHNSNYWKNQEYWGIGLSAHSYSFQGPWGTRFWNPPTFSSYAKRVEQGLDQSYQEILRFHEALTDHLHVSLRQSGGVQWQALYDRFGDLALHTIREQAQQFAQKTGWIEVHDQGFRLSQAGVWLSDQVFQEFVILEGILTS